jgi:aldehyde dehydrogenase (NAD+)
MAGLTEQIEVMAGSLRAVFESGRTKRLDWRKEQLNGIDRMLVEQEQLFAQALHSDLGKSATEAYTTEIAIVRAEIKHALSNLSKWTRPERVALPMNQRPGKAEIHREPLGAVLVIAPWNYPLQLLILPMVAAITAGNVVLGKPSELAPHTAAAVAKVLPEYVDDGVQVIEGGIDEAKALLATRWDHIFYTGSGRIASEVLMAAAPNLTPVTLELGGKSPAIVHKSAEIEIAARRIAWGAFVNAGQTCVAPDYVLVHRPIAEEFTDALLASLNEFYGDDPKKSPDYGRVINHRHLRRLKGLLDSLPVAQIVVGGQIDEQDRYLAPTIVMDPDPGSDLMSDEIFGPILPLLTVESMNEAVAFVQSRPRPLASYVFSEDKAVVEQVLTDVSSGGAVVNHTLLHLAVPALPFGGVGASGMGAYHGRAGFENLSHRKAVLRKASKPDVKLLYPPYTKIKRKLLRKLI